MSGTKTTRCQRTEMDHFFVALKSRLVSDFHLNISLLGQFVVYSLWCLIIMIILLAYYQKCDTVVSVWSLRLNIKPVANLECCKFPDCERFNF